MSVHLDNSASSTETPLSDEQREEILDQYGVSEVDALANQTTLALAHREADQFEASESWRQTLVRSVQDAYLRESGKIAIPDAMDIAMIDASHWVIHEFSAREEFMLRQDLLPAFIEVMLDLFVAFADRGVDTAAYIQPVGGGSSDTSQRA